LNEEAGTKSEESEKQKISFFVPRCAFFILDSLFFIHCALLTRAKKFSRFIESRVAQI
jgi:hypothetical protein